MKFNTYLKHAIEENLIAIKPECFKHIINYGTKYDYNIVALKMINDINVEYYPTEVLDYVTGGLLAIFNMNIYSTKTNTMSVLETSNKFSRIVNRYVNSYKDTSREVDEYGITLDTRNDSLIVSIYEISSKETVLTFGIKYSFHYMGLKYFIKTNKMSDYVYYEFSDYIKLDSCLMDMSDTNKAYIITLFLLNKEVEDDFKSLVCDEDIDDEYIVNTYKKLIK